MEKAHLGNITVAESKEGFIAKKQAILQIKVCSNKGGGGHFIYLLKLHKILMSEPLTKCCASDLEGLQINFLANIVQGGAQASGSFRPSYHTSEQHE